MHYQVSRNGQTYGPYTLEDLQRYVASGNVLLNDLARSEEMPDWVPVSQLLNPAATPPSTPGFAPAGFSTPGYADPGTPSSGPQSFQPVGSMEPVYTPAHTPAHTPAQALASSPYPDAPNLHWGLVFLFGLLTCTLFMPIWNLIVSAWLRRVQPNSTAMFLWIGVVVLLALNFLVGGILTMHTLATADHSPYGRHLGIRLGFAFIIWVVRLVARFSERASLEEHFNGPEAVGLNLNPVMTFFFGGVYFQSQLNRIHAMKEAARYGAGRAF